MKPPNFLYFPILYTFFIIYGSLVPLDYRDIPFEDALQSFQQIRYLDLGAASRADWIANILLYIPLTFSLAALTSNKAKSLATLIFTSTLILSFSITLAVTIEFYQQFFPPRTVSQNDLIAETLGSIIGIGLWLGYGKHFAQLQKQILHGGKNALLASAVLYTLGYLALSFFPYDFVTSFQELQNKLDKGLDAFFISDSCGPFIQCSTKLATESFLALPLGLFLSVLLRWHRRRLTAIILIGIVLGLLIESLQLFLISGIAQGISIFTRLLGMWAGEKIYTKIGALKAPFSLHIPHLKKYLLIAAIPYLLILANLNGWTLAEGQFNTDISAKFQKINWLPFYYHYYTTEAVALTSLMSVFAMYLPIGIGFWLWSQHKNPSLQISYKLPAALYTLCLCFIIETGKLFFLSKHPDPTNLIISFAAVFLSYSFIDLMYQWFHQPETKNTDEQTPLLAHSIAEENAKPPAQNSHPSAKIIATTLCALVLWKIITYPGSIISLSAILIAYGALLRKYPQAWIVAIPALIPIADLSPWTGRLFFSEFDFFILLSFAITLWYGRWQSPLQFMKLGGVLLLSLYSLFYFISLLKGLLPFQPLDANAFTNYYSQYNSLRVAKGLIGSLLLLPMLAYNFHNQHNIRLLFSYGMLTGLLITSLAAIWERIIFTGLFDYSADFRISSTFYSMHTGGAPLDAYLLLSIPFISILLIESKHTLRNTLVGCLLFGISLYTLLVTYSRGTYIAFAIMMLMLITGLILHYKDQLKLNLQKALWVPLFLILITLITIPVLNGSFIQHRFKLANQEITIRSDHWKNAIEIMDNGIFTSLFGMGTGSFPRSYLWNNFADSAPATFTLQEENNAHYLQLSAGSPLYIEQKINPKPYTAYQLQVDYRPYARTSHLTVSICEKAIQNSFTCQSIQTSPKKTQDHWQHFIGTLNTEEIGFSYRPVKFILHNGSKTAIDIKNISLRSTDKNNLLKNTNFEKGMDHWFFTADEHIPWRTENLWVQLLFDQGWLGLITFNFMLLYLFIYLYKNARNKAPYSIITMSALTGFLILSVIDSTLDHPAISLLFFMMLYIMLLQERSLLKRRRSRR